MKDNRDFRVGESTIHTDMSFTCDGHIFGIEVYQRQGSEMHRKKGDT